MSSSHLLSPTYAPKLRAFGLRALITLFALMLLSAYLMPFAYGFTTALKTQDQITANNLFPLSPEVFIYDGRAYPLYEVPTEQGIQQWALIRKGRDSSEFINPLSAEAGLIEWQGRWRTLQPVLRFDPHWENFSIAWETINFPRLFVNTLSIAAIGSIGTLLSCIAVAYAFARFPIPGKNILFVVLVGTIILPRQVTLVPTYAFFASIGWTGTWLPLIVPHFFANAYNVFLLRQYFLSLPPELDEAAMVDGATPFQILTHVIIPQSWPAIIAVGLFHFVWAWNDYFEPLIYLVGNRELQPISVGIQLFNFQYNTQPHLIQATSLIGLLFPVLLFLIAQRAFMRGIVITGVEK